MAVSIAILGTMIIVRAAYNGTANVKRVVSTQASSNTVFSSNYMESGELVVKNLRTTVEGDYICNVTVCNYDQLNVGSPARALITYNFSAELMKYDQAQSKYVKVDTPQLNEEVAKTFYVQKHLDNNEEVIGATQYNLNSGSFSYTYENETLLGETPYKDSFDICFDSSEVSKDIPELFVKVVAVPTQESVQLNGTLPTLSCVISISQGRTVETGWHGSLNESNTLNYDGYNLVVEGSGKGTIDILWDNSRFTINPAFLEINSSKLSIPMDAAETDWKTITLTVDSTDVNRYVVQFYKKTPDTDYIGTEFPSKYIKCNNYVADTQTVNP